MAIDQSNRFSRLSLGVYAGVAFMGVTTGVIMYLQRPAVTPPNDPANNAIALHLILAIGATITAVVIQMYRTRHRQSNIWLAPFKQRAVRRVLATLRPRRASVAAIVRIPLMIVLLLLLLWEPYRGAAQPFAALSPATTVNAWGGPSYLGATFAHLLDGVVVFYVAAFLLHLVLVRQISRVSRLG
ncbi:hypothetical protein JNM87_03515 [Candidatus Saccharibacteria bacterium]|nr:hypothetical protein [Candidatus Saccharibacteria bacterium]